MTDSFSVNDHQLMWKQSNHTTRGQNTVFDIYISLYKGSIVYHSYNDDTDVIMNEKSMIQMGDFPHASSPPPHCDSH